MKLVGKCINFCKENKIIVAALAVVLLSFVFLALPGQFGHYLLDSTVKKPYTYNYNLSGYGFMFGIAKHKYTGEQLSDFKPVAQGIAIFIMLILCVPGLLFSKKSSFVALLTSLSLVTIAILFFTISAASPVVGKSSNADARIYMDWVPYVLGGLIMLVGLAMCYRTFLVLKEEAKSPTQPKGPSYSYLKK